MHIMYEMCSCCSSYIFMHCTFYNYVLRYYVGNISGYKFIDEEETSVMTTKYYDLRPTFSEIAVGDNIEVTTIKEGNFNTVRSHAETWLNHMLLLLPHDKSHVTPITTR
jgi:hypothetical protein